MVIGNYQYSISKIQNTEVNQMKKLDLSAERRLRIKVEKVAMIGWLIVWAIGFITIAFVHTIWGMAICSGAIIMFLVYYLPWRKDTGRD